MPYITLQGLIDRYGEIELVQLTDALGDGQIDTTKIDLAVADADAEIDSYLAGLGILPLQSIPAVLEKHAATMVRYYLYKDAAPDLIKAQYDEAIARLRDISRGTASLGITPAGAATPNTASPSWASADPVFSADALSGF